MQVSVEKVSNVERRLTVVVPANQLEEAYTKQINEFAKNANIKGFRPGKAPMSYIQQQYGDDARKEALNEVIQKTLYQAITDQNLRPISTPRIEPKTMLANQPLEYIASFEVLPELSEVKFKGEKIEKPVVEVTNDDVEKVVAQLIKQYTKWKQVDRPAQLKDRVVVTYYAILDGKSDEENKVQNFPLELGSKVMLPGFEDALIGLKAGDTKHINLTFPADFHIAEKAGTPIEFNVEVKQVMEADLPAIDEDFVKRLGVKSGSQDELKQQIKQSLEQERDRLVKEKLKEQIFQQILDQNPLEIPQSLIEREAKNIHDEVYQNQHHDHHQHSAEEMTGFNEIAKKRVAVSLLIAEYAKQANIQVDKERVQKRIQEIASVYENPQEVAAWLSAEERKSGIESQVMEDQVLDKLMESASVTDKVMSYADLRGVQI